MKRREVLKSPWGWQATKEMKVRVAHDYCLSLHLLIQDTLQSKVYTRVSNFRNMCMVLGFY